MEDSLVSRRPKRSTAGNRMEAALAEFKAEDLGMDVEEDGDFALDKDEEDIFESDFESTDEEGAQEDVDAAAENLIRQEESRVRKTARTHLERVTALAHARQAATFNPSTIAPPPPDKQKAQKKISRRVSLGIAVNVETGEVLEGGENEDATASAAVLTPGGRRHSTRTHTVANTSATVSRVRDEVRKQSSTPKRAKTKTKAPTQAELVARALDMEEGNIEQHKNYLTIEEEKRRKAQVVRASVQGPLIRWVSKKEEVTVLVLPTPPTPPVPLPPRPVVNPYIHYQYPPLPSPSGTSPGTSRPASHTQTSSQYWPSQYTPQQYSPTQNSPSQHRQVSTQHAAPQPQSHVPPSGSVSSTMPPQSAPFEQWPPPPARPSYFHPSSSSTTPTNLATAPSTPSYASPSFVHSSASAWIPPTPAPPPSRPIERKETVGKQYVVHELGQTDRSPRPKWNSTMTALFGDHADWENLRVYTTKGRPFARPTQICPITGKVAKYLDPRTNVPYADLSAYRVLSAILRHEHVWSPRLGCYVSREGSVLAQGDS
ncbi:YL1 nuclear protein-domain-containing protein [Cerioporus squamosus]|nr:YL1 nuclear protein-domain-containing protein [Cerioporus squamosus]